MGGVCNKNKGAEKLQKLNIRVYSSKVKPMTANGINEIPLWEKEYEHYDEKQLALECKRLETEIKGRLERLSKVNESLNTKKDFHSETVEQIDLSEEQYSKINESSKRLLNDIKRQTTMLTENYLHELKTDTEERRSHKLDSKTEEWFAKVTKQEYKPVPKHRKGKTKEHNPKS